MEDRQQDVHTPRGRTAGLTRWNVLAQLAGPGLRAERESHRAFGWIGHVGLSGDGGGSGGGGRDRSFMLTEDVDVLQHYRAALPKAG